PIVTQIQPASAYWLASDEHQQYFEKKSAKHASYVSTNFDFSPV
ncbi:MAG: hypothetical protein F6K35_41300, partial [Okeania sp. SIO2H7]|nr:hypothetical protein [Okeania sp. SIO2H7]